VAPRPVADDRTHVLIDCTAIPAHRGGVGRYIEGLLGGLTSDEIILSLVVQRRDRHALSKLVPWATVTPISRWFQIRILRIVWEQFALPGVARKLNIDVVHSPHYTFPLSWSGGRVVTVHDATFFSHPDAHEFIKRWFFRSWTRRAWKAADVVITPSAATGDEVARFLGSPIAALEVAHLGVDLTRFHPPSADELQALRSRLNLPPDSQWFAFLGTIEPRKNVVALLDAYQAVREEFGDHAPELLISGGRGWDGRAAARLNSLPADSGVHELGYLPMTSLSALLGGAVAVAYPSIAEGFGLPVLEAMAAGAAVITTDRLAIPEVGGEAVLYAEPTPSALQSAMRLLLVDETENSRLRALAVTRASLFTWHATALRHVAAYALAAEARPGQ
jgi:glycosyltransferase involved in cell wall biosynthesis